jgi:hypothetical protein
MITITIKKETVMLDFEGMKMLQGGYIGSDWQLRKNYLNLLEDISRFLVLING